MATTAHGELAGRVATSSGQCLHGGRDIICGLGLHNTSRLELDIDRPVRVYGLLVGGAAGTDDLVTDFTLGESSTLVKLVAFSFAVACGLRYSRIDRRTPQERSLCLWPE